VTEGFSKIEDVALVPLEDLAGIEGFDEEVANELRERARAYLQAQDERLALRRKELGVSDEIAAIEGLTTAMLVALGEAGVKTLDDLADLSGDELTSRSDGILRNFPLSEADANAMVMAARAHWFDGEDKKPAGAPAESEKSA
jgi:N utilization substance protein A